MNKNFSNIAGIINYIRRIFERMESCREDLMISEEKVKIQNANIKSSNVNVKSSNAYVKSSDANIKSSKANVKSSKANVRSLKANIKSLKANIKSSKANIRSSNANIRSNGAYKKDAGTKKRRSIGLEIYQNADMYLHYSNYIVIYASNSLPVINIILVKLTGTGVTGKMIMIIFSDSDSVIFYLNFNEAIQTFDGVIERYCGVPP
jgi:septal ring factor EnvC (AmiA/AmiB activator)